MSLDTMSKKEMAIKIVKVLFNVDEIEGKYLERKVRAFARWNKEHLIEEYKAALKVFK